MYRPSCSKLSALAIATFILLTAYVPPVHAQEQSTFLVRIFQMTMEHYTCTALTADHLLEQLTVITDRGTPPPSELRRGSATDEDVKKINELLDQPQMRSATSETPRFPGVLIQRYGKFIAVLARIDEKPKFLQFTDTEGQKTMPAYLKGFDAFAESVRRRKLPKQDKATPTCRVEMR